MTLYIINKSNAITIGEILDVVPSSFGWTVPATDIPIIKDQNGTFGNDPRAVYITDDEDDILHYAGATYIYGAATIYDVSGTIQRLGNRLGKFVVALRVWHEVLHHYALPADGMDDWIKDRPILKFLYGISSPERWIGAHIQMIYYNYLTNRLNPEDFDSQYSIADRTYQGRK